ncbi:hypothetical protein RB195_014847 [Necator americanus]
MLKLCAVAAVLFSRNAFSQIEERCCCGCPPASCTITLSEECLADATTSCSEKDKFNSSKTVIDCSLLLTTTALPTLEDDDNEFIPIPKDSEEKDVRTSTKPPLELGSSTQNKIQGRSPFFGNPFFPKPLMPPPFMGGPYDAHMNVPPMSGWQQYGWGADVGNLFARIMDHIRDFVGTVLVRASGQLPLNQINSRMYGLK